jgi:hypothetical protein
MAEECGLGNKVKSSGYVLDTFRPVIEALPDGAILLIAGSFFIMRDVAIVLSDYGVSIADVEPDDIELNEIFQAQTSSRQETRNV